jgi:hypothetical protein
MEMGNQTGYPRVGLTFKHPDPSTISGNSFFALDVYMLLTNESKELLAEEGSSFDILSIQFYSPSSRNE